jgi:hypothetical protein
MTKFFMTLAASLFVLSLCAGTSAQEPEADKAKEYRAVESLKSKGFKACADTATSVMKFLHKTDDFAYLNTWNVKEADTHAASVFTVKPYSDGNSYASMTAQVRADGGCDAAFTQIFYFAETCPKLRDTTFKDWKFYMDLGGVPVYEDPTSTTVVIALAPAGNGCLVLKNGTFYFAAKEKAK